MNDENLILETSECKTCPHGFAFLSKCPVCSCWISVKDKMPEEMQDVLFVFIRDKVVTEYAIGHYCTEGWNSCFIHNSHKLSNDPSIIKVTHWMSLPIYMEQTK